MKAVVAAFNQEKALVGAFSVFVQLHRLIVYSTTADVNTERGPRPDSAQPSSRKLVDREAATEQFSNTQLLLLLATSVPRLNTE